MFGADPVVITCPQVPRRASSSLSFGSKSDSSRNCLCSPTLPPRACNSSGERSRQRMCRGTATKCCRSITFSCRLAIVKRSPCGWEPTQHHTGCSVSTAPATDQVSAVNTGRWAVRCSPQFPLGLSNLGGETFGSGIADDDGRARPGAPGVQQAGHAYPALPTTWQLVAQRREGVGGGMIGHSRTSIPVRPRVAVCKHRPGPFCAVHCEPTPIRWSTSTDVGEG